MALRTKFPIVVLLSCFIFVLGAVASELADPEAELHRCKHQCRALRRADEWEKRVCEEKCDKYYEEKQRRERQEEGWKRIAERPEKQYRKCKEQCHEELDVPRHQRLCERRCEEVYRERKHRDENERQQNRIQQPYVSRDQDFATSVQIQHGGARVVQKFTKELL